MKKSMLSFFMAVCILLPGNLQAEQALPKVQAKGAALIEQESGRVLFEKAGEEPLPMASTTKMMTCIVAIEEGKLDDIVTTSKRASCAPPVKLHLKVGEKQRLGDLLYALMLQSDNDVAVAVAEHVGGSVEHFCEMMTQKARTLGMTHTVFKTPNGLDAEGHAASAHDMAILGAYALKNPKFLEIVTTTQITIPTQPTEGSVVHDLMCKNRFIYSYEGANGIKTGFTNKAGHCFVGGAKRHDMQLVAAALGSGWGKQGKTQKYTDVINMMNYGFKQYAMTTLVVPKEDWAMVPVEKSLCQSMAVRCEDTIRMPLNQEEQAAICIKTELPAKMMAPIHEGEKVGEVVVLCEGVVLKKVPLYASSEVAKATPLDYIKAWLNRRSETKK